MTTLKLQYGVISTDEHVQETPDVWTSRMSKAKFGLDIPQIRELPDGSDAWFIANAPPVGSRVKQSVASVAAAMEPRNAVPRRWEDVPKNTYVPSERLKAMDIDQVDTHTFFPNVAGFSNNRFQQEGTEEFRLACIQAYNDWLVEEWTAFSPRYIAQTIAPMWNVEMAVGEVHRSVKNGHKALIWHGATEVFGLPHFNESHWDPIYATCQDLDIPMCLHLGAVPVLEAWKGYTPATGLAMHSTRAISSQIQIIANVLFSGVLDRFPRLKVIMVESGIGWIPYVLELADHEYHNLGVAGEGLTTLPSEAFRRQVYANFWYERFGLKNRYDIGVDNIIYETDFPHPTSTWPNSKAIREKAMDGIPADECKKMLMTNAVSLYKLDVDASALEGRN